MADGKLIATLPGEIGRIEIHAMTPAGFIGLHSYIDRSICQKDREIVKVWDCNRCECVGTLFDEQTSLGDYTYSAGIGPRGLQAVTGHRDGSFRIWTIMPPDLLDTLSTISLEQLWLLEGIFEQASKGKKADLSDINKPEIVNYIQQYGLLPNLIKDLVKDCVKFE